MLAGVHSDLVKVRVDPERLKMKADELPGGGPAYTNDLTSITDL